MCCLLLVLALSLALPAALSTSYTPSWHGPDLHPWLPGGGLPAAKGAKWARIYHAEPDFGTYNHACMIDAFNGSFIAYWKNSPRDEDQPGQRVLWSYSADGQQWTPTDGANILFPNMSTASNFHVALFAEPALHINGRQCVDLLAMSIARSFHPHATTAGMLLHHRSSFVSILPHFLKYANPCPCPCSSHPHSRIPYHRAP
jgi:hypothetical protein